MTNKNTITGIFTTQVPHGWVAVDGEEIVLSEFSPKTVGAFVWFLCSDEVNLSAPYRDLLALYRLAYKYDVPMLKQVAVDALATKIDVDSVIEILVEMKERLTTFIVSHFCCALTAMYLHVPPGPPSKKYY